MTSCDFDDLDKGMVALPAEGIGSGTLEVTESVPGNRFSLHAAA